MRYAALAFGVLAGLVASFILALSGLDVTALMHAGQRQMQLMSFGLYIIANLGVLGAGLVLAAPIAGAALFFVGAAGWIGAALFLGHGPDFVMLTPPGLLLAALVFSILAWLRRPGPGSRRRATDLDEDDGEADAEDEEEQEPAPPPRQPQRAAAPASPGPEDFEELPPVKVGAGFFGLGGTAMPLQPDPARQPAPPPQRPAAAPLPRQGQAPQSRQPAPPQSMPLRSTLDDDEIRGTVNPEDWRPGRRRPPPPRQKPIFRSPEDLDEEDEDDDEESGGSRLVRGVASVLSFGLYAGLAGAAVLVLWNARTLDIGHPTASKLDSTSVAAVSSSAAPASPVLSSSAPASSLAIAPPPDSSVADAVAAPADANAASEFPARDAGLALLGQTASVAPELTAPDPASAEPAASAEPGPAEEPVTPTVGAMMPDEMPPAMAAERLKPAPKPTPPEPNVETGTPLAIQPAGGDVGL